MPTIKQSMTRPASGAVRGDPAEQARTPLTASPSPSIPATPVYMQPSPFWLRSLPAMAASNDTLLRQFYRVGRPVVRRFLPLVTK